jgi:hypothetical protein
MDDMNDYLSFRIIALPNQKRNTQSSWYFLQQQYSVISLAKLALLS